ncbi:hypothetical protein FA292_28785, partial [Pseudomonas aeruginosa]|nr:hypothetical protein [Pseudomonas aeruginosa]
MVLQGKEPPPEESRISKTFLSELLNFSESSLKSPWLSITFLLHSSIGLSNDPCLGRFSPSPLPPPSPSEPPPLPPEPEPSPPLPSPPVEPQSLPTWPWQGLL